MKSIAAIPAIFGLLLAILVSPLQAQDETDDLYINSKDIAKKREKAKEQVSIEKTYYTYPQQGNSAPQANTSTDQGRFSEPGYTNKYIEAEKNEKLSSGVTSNVSTPTNNSNYNTVDAQSEDLRWLKNNRRSLRRKAYGSQYSISPAIGYNNYSGFNTGIGFGINSGWNNWYGWNSPYYNGWNNYGYGGYGNGFGIGFGFNNGFYNPYSFGNYYYSSYSPGWFVGYNSYGNYNSGYGYGGYGYNPYSWGAWGNPYYGWRPVVYVPVNSYTNNNNGGGSSVNYGPLSDRSSPSGRNSFPQGNQGGSSGPSRYGNIDNSHVEGTRGGGSVPTNGNTNSRNGGNQYGNSVPSRDGYSNPAPSNSSPTIQQPTQNSRVSESSRSREFSVPSRDRSNDVFSKPSNSWGGNNGSGNGSRGGGDIGGGNSGGGNRMGGSGGGGGGNSGGGGGNSGGGGGSVPGGR